MHQFERVLIEHLNARGGQVNDLLVVKDDVDHRSSPQVSEIQSQLGAAPGVNPCVVALSRGSFERLADDEFRVAIVIWGNREQVTAHMGRRGQSESVQALLGRITIKRRPPLTADCEIPLQVVIRNRVRASCVRGDKTS